MPRATLTDLINAINASIVENTAGDISATEVNQLLQYLSNNLYLPTDSTVTVNGTSGIKTFTFSGGITVTVDGVAGTANLVLPDAPPPVIYGEMNITNQAETIIIGAGQTTGVDLLPITAGTTYFQVPGYAGGIQEGLVYDATNGGLRATVSGTYHFDGWLSLSSDTNNTTAGVVFGIKRGGTIIGTSPRPTPSWLPNAGRRGNISGTGLVQMLQDDVVVALIGADTACTLTVSNSTLVGKLLKGV
ncbi:hypothetical protein 13VV501A_gene0008 [Vibrio phage 13VV501A]|nr:hypothetical protein 13VV501A_gene0008 [Vibrio phage 13VV501A]